MDSTSAKVVAPFPDASGENFREPPVNYEAEQALLGAILANNTAFEKVADFLRAEHFAEPMHGEIYAACGTLIDRGQQANAITLKNHFERNEALTDVGGAKYLSDLQGNYVSIINARDYGRTIHDLYLRRQLIAVGEDVVNEAFDHDLEESAQQQIEKTEQKLYSLAESGQTEGGFRDFKSAVIESINTAEAALKSDGHVAGVATGFAELDRLLGGLHDSDLVILAGRPSMGKTAFATNIAYNVANTKGLSRDGNGDLVEQTQVVAFFSLEMSTEQLATRILSECTSVRSDALRRGKIPEEDFTRVSQAAQTLYRLPLYIDDTPALTVPALRMRARRLKRQHGLSLIVIDYLQLMQSATPSRGDNRVQEVSEITRGLKAIAKELNVPVVALSQLSRQTEQRDDKRPQLSDLRESGSIEQDADMVVFLFREEYYLAREKPTQRANETDDSFSKRRASYEKRTEDTANLAEVIVAKQRHGPIGTVTLHFDGAFTRFSDLAQEDHLPARYD